MYSAPATLMSKSNGKEKKCIKRRWLKILNPEWDNESVVIRVRILRDEQAENTEPLLLEVYDYDRVGTHDLLGHATIPVNTLIRPVGC